VFYIVLYGLRPLESGITTLEGGLLIPAGFLSSWFELALDIFPRRDKLREKLKAFTFDPWVVRTTESGIFGPPVILSF
jgi:hypothetical protein